MKRKVKKMNVNEIWCSICCRYMDDGCKNCSHFDEQVYLDQEDKVETSPEHLFIDISPMDECKNMMESYGEICVKCNKCGRFGRR